MMDRFLAAIIDDDLPKVKELLERDGGLVIRPIREARLYTSKIFHWIYVGDTDAPAFQNGWGNVGDPKAPMRFRYLAARDTLTGLPGIEIQGSVVGGSVGTTIFTMPITFDWDVHLPATDDAGSFEVFTVKQNGDVMWGVT